MVFKVLFVGNTAFFSPVQLLKAYVPKAVTVFGIVIDVRPMHPLKA
jgi:hypothetical protein